LSIVLTMMHPHSCHWKIPFDMPNVHGMKCHQTQS
jgi:hypothetical protein